MGKFLHPKKSSCNVETLTMERLFRHRVSSCNAGANLLTSAWLGQERDSWVTSLYKRIQSRNRRKYEERLTAASLNRRSYGSWMQQLSERWFPKKIAAQRKVHGKLNASWKISSLAVKRFYSNFTSELSGFFFLVFNGAMVRAHFQACNTE